jgi:cytochrome P450
MTSVTPAGDRHPCRPFDHIGKSCPRLLALKSTVHWSWPLGRGSRHSPSRVIGIVEGEGSNAGNQATTMTCPVHALQEEYNPFVAPQLINPFPVWSQARAEQPVFHSSVLDAWVVTRYADVITVLRNPAVFGPIAERKIFAEPCREAEVILAELPPLEDTNAISAEPPVHTKLRRYLQPAFMPRKVARLEPEFQQMANELIGRFEERGSGDFYNDYAFRFPLSVVCRLVGLSAEYHDQVKEWASGRIDLRYGNLSVEEQVEAAKGQRDSYAFNLDLVGRRRAEPGDDLLSWIIQDSDASDDPMTDAQLASQATALLTAGHETTSHWLTMLMHRVLLDRKLWAALPDDAALSSSVVEESLRMDGPAQAVWRKAKVDADVGGVHISAGERVSLVLASANADETAFQSPDVFQLDRPNVTKHVAFGRGIHTCVGAGIARLEGRISLRVLSSRLPKLRLAADDGYMFKPSAIQRMARRLYVEWT